MPKAIPINNTPAPPPMPAETEEEMRHSAELGRQMAEIALFLRRRNLASAVLLAQQALAGRGPLVEHFAELGRRFGGTLDQPEPKPLLRVIEGRAP